MSTLRSFSAMLNDYLPNRLLKEELLKRDWLLQNIERDDNWGGGSVIVPFRGSIPTSVAVGSLTSESDIAESTLVRGTISSYQELWHSMILRFRDLVDHEGKIPEDTFLKVVPDELEASMDYMKLALNSLLCNGSSFALATGNGAVGGTITVNKIDQFYLGQKVVLDDDNSASAEYYVIAIDVNTLTVTLSASRGGAAADISAYTLAQNAKFYFPGAISASFNSLRSTLLSSANGGASTIHGQTKTAYPFLQAVNVSGSDITASNLLDKLFDKLSTVQQAARGGKITVAAMSLYNLGTVLKLIQSEKGAFHVAPNSFKATEFGWTEIMIGTPAGNMIKLVGLQEMFNDVIYLLDMKSMVFRSKGFIRKHKNPDGLEYYTTRSASNGYSYILDMCVFGELEVSKPGANGVIYGISY